MTAKLDGGGTRVRGCFAVSASRLGFWAKLLTVAAIAISQIGTASPAAAQAKTKVNPKDGMTYVWIEPGTFQMGCSPNDSGCAPNEKPAHMVTITKGFWIGKTMVTQAVYTKTVVALNIDRTDQLQRPVEINGINPSIFKGPQLPVEQISWTDANAYCEATGMRLPTEAEWEYAARGGSTEAAYGQLEEVAWYGGNANSFTHNVAQKQPNAFGLYDMLGNVWEWVSDFYGSYSPAAATDPQGPAHGVDRVMRGGSFLVGHVSLSVREGGQPWIHSSNDGGDRGIRCAGN